MAWGEGHRPGLFVLVQRTSMDFVCVIERSRRTRNLCPSTYQRFQQADKKDALVCRGTVVWPNEIGKALVEHRSQVEKYINAKKERRCRQRIE